MNKFPVGTTFLVQFNGDCEPKFEKATVTESSDKNVTLRFVDGIQAKYVVSFLSNPEMVTIKNVKMPMSPHDSALDFLLTHCKGEVGKCVDLKTTDGTMTKVIDVQVSNFIVTLFESEEAFGIYTLDDEPVGSEDIPLRFLRHIVPPMLDIHELTADA